MRFIVYYICIYIIFNLSKRYYVIYKKSSGLSQEKQCLQTEQDSTDKTKFKNYKPNMKRINHMFIALSFGKDLVGQKCGSILTSLFYEFIILIIFIF